MLGRLFQKKGVDPREEYENPINKPHWSQVERKIPPHYFEWIAGITEELNQNYRDSLPPIISNKCKRKFVKFAKNS
jgi:hypothetical protein